MKPLTIKYLIVELIWIGGYGTNIFVLLLWIYGLGDDERLRILLLVMMRIVRFCKYCVILSVIVVNNVLLHHDSK